MSCGKKKCHYQVYNWVIPATFSPANDTFSIGDTITVTSIFDENVYNKYIGTNNKLVNYNFEPACLLLQIDSIPPSEKELVGKLSNYATLIVDSVHVFYLLNDYRGFEIASGYYSNWDNAYRLTYKLVLKKKGLFLFNHYSTLFESGYGGQEFEERCANSDVRASVNLNNGSSNNIEMLHDGYDTYEGGYIEFILRDTQKLFRDKGGYVFYVKE